ncbi:MAG TPA: DUF2975 domain-containing protein [Solirubrobacteraceae bacterium]|nr:DUF2975 domain-containing protein [Solirubrobacteraceae bacterium]
MKSREPTYAAVVAHRLTTLLFVAALGFALYVGISTATGHQNGDIVFEAQAPLDEKRIPTGLYTTGEQRTTMVIDRPSTHEQKLAGARDAIPLLLVAAVMWLLRGIARSVRDGDPFIGENVRRLRAIGVLLVAGVLAVRFLEGELQDALLDPYLGSPSPDSTAAGLQAPDEGDFPGVQLLCGLGAFVLAQVFAHGVRLREDVEATI